MASNTKLTDDDASGTGERQQSRGSLSALGAPGTIWSTQIVYDLADAYAMLSVLVSQMNTAGIGPQLRVDLRRFSSSSADSLIDRPRVNGWNTVALWWRGAHLVSTHSDEDPEASGCTKSRTLLLWPDSFSYDRPDAPTRQTEILEVYL